MSTTAPPAYGPPTTAPAWHPATRLRRPLPALVASLGIVGAFLLLAIIELVASAVYNEVSSRFSSGPSQVIATSVFSLRQDVPVLIVVLVVSFLFFWGVAPIHAALRIGQVINRGVWCAVAAGIVMGVVFFVQFLVIVSTPAVSAYGGPSLHDLLRNSAQSGVEAVDYFGQTIAFIVLGGVLLWTWTRTHPALDLPAEAGATLV
jgi:hypothetical protein